MVSATALASDPLRALRLARLACELEFEVDAETGAAAAAVAPALGGVAAERVFAEFKRIIRGVKPGDVLVLFVYAPTLDQHQLKTVRVEDR